MPELPEVELYTRYFHEHALNQRIARVQVRDSRILGNVTEEKFKRRVRGKTFRSVTRHGKHLFADLGSEWLHLHFGMSGDLAYYSAKGDEPRFARVIFDFDNGSHLAFEDMRLFGVVELTPSPAFYIEEHHLGPDPLDAGFDLRKFRDLLRGRRGAIKALLLMQEVIAGIGNLYADETLFQAGIHPKRPGDHLTGGEVRTIFTAMRRILKTTIGRKAQFESYPPNYLTLHREEGDRCPRCGGEIDKTVVFGRTTYFCPAHQK
jgi:formamidopyrimidine-DNA glycosylase